MIGSTLCRYRTVAALAAGVLLIALIGATQIGRAEGSTEGGESSGSSFPGWQQNFNHDADEWLGFEEGIWCGSIERVRRGEGEVAPSAGRAHAEARGGECIDPFKDDFEPSGPFSGGVPLSTEWPESGFVVQMDVYLDPENGGFDYYVPISLLDVRQEKGLPASVRYFKVPVTSKGGALLVGEQEHAIDQAGWYTFRHRFDEDDNGQLEVTFELAERRGGTLATEPLTDHFGATGLADPEAADFDAANVGNAYIWLNLSHDQVLPIDRYQIRRG